MNFKYMYIDESGNLGFNGTRSTKFFIISALVVDNPKELDRIIKNARRNKFKKELKTVSELKASKSTPSLVKYILNKINEVSGLQIFHIILDKNEVKSSFLRNDKHKLYNFVAGKLAKNILMSDVDLDICIDKSKGKLFLINDFDRYFKANLFNGNSNIKCKISHNYSYSFSGLQIVDFIVWSVFQKYERKNSVYNDEITIEQEVYQVWY